MRSKRWPLVAGVAALALAGIASTARAGGDQTHTITIQLPGGSAEQIIYTGDVAPQVVLTPAEELREWTPFAMFDRLSAELDREATALLREAGQFSNTMAPDVEQIMKPDPAGETAGGYSFVASLSGDGVCVRSLTITSRGDGAQPKLVSRQSGNCGTQRPDTVEAKAQAAPAARPPGGLVRRVAWQQ